MEKSGIYLWILKDSGKMYVGSAVDLSLKLKDYYSPLNLIRRDTYIFRAIISHGHSAFSLSILEYIDITNLSKEKIKALIFSKEQYYFDLYLPEYNTQKIARSSLGQKRSEATKALISKIKSGLTHTPKTRLKINETLKGKNLSKTLNTETRTKMALAKIGNKNPNFGKVHTAESRAKMGVREIPIFVYLLDGTLENNFTSVTEAGKFFKAQNKTILKYVKSGEIFREKYLHLKNSRTNNNDRGNILLLQVINVVKFVNQ
ncbi:hypothetical protein EMPS_mp27 (mitochondrion) [Entomortierella parvispora]|uniref:GIY-YIG domain-containing protein n=1 Tax=Entomortierella parvispora TaxID=205924 RepID=A0A8J9RQ69_9FUNG|nr:hypothetical protein EMPS_mp27 [Entomortierella parvispora]